MTTEDELKQRADKDLTRLFEIGNRAADDAPASYEDDPPAFFVGCISVLSQRLSRLEAAVELVAKCMEELGAKHD